MSKLTAHSIIPIVKTLPKSEIRVLADQLNNILGKEKKDTTIDKELNDLPDIFKPENKARLQYEIMHGKSS